MMCGDDQTTTTTKRARRAAAWPPATMRTTVMRGGGQLVMRGRVQWQWEAPGGGGARGRRPLGSTRTRARRAGASYLLGTIEHDEAWHGYTVLCG